jgi:hypothetical protein
MRTKNDFARIKLLNDFALTAILFPLAGPSLPRLPANLFTDNNDRVSDNFVDSTTIA